MGRHVEYVRRKRDRECYNPDGIQISHFVANCECTERDYECDRGYRRVPLDSGPCERGLRGEARFIMAPSHTPPPGPHPFAGVRDPEVPIDAAALVPHYCRPGLHYHVTNGYRPVAGDSCVGGVQHEMLIHPCPGSTWAHHVSHGGWTVLLVMLTLGLAMFAITYFNGPLKRASSGAGGGGAGRFGGGGLSNKPEAVLPSWVPRALGRPLGVAVAVGLASLRMARAAVSAAVAYVANAVRRLSGAPPKHAGPGYSTRGLARGSAGAAPGLAYDAVGRGGAQPESAAGDDVEGGGGRGGADDDDFGSFGVDGGDDVSREPDLLGLGLGGARGSSGNEGSLAGAPRGSSSGGVSSDPVPVLRPPRSHAESALKARH